MNKESQFVCGQQVEKFLAIVLELLASFDVSEQRWSDNLDAFEGNKANAFTRLDMTTN